MSRSWIRADLTQIQKELKGKTHITSSVSEGYRTAKSWIIYYMNFGDLHKTLEVK